jgi:hypothetical protein
MHGAYRGAVAVERRRMMDDEHGGWIPSHSARFQSRGGWIQSRGAKDPHPTSRYESCGVLRKAGLTMNSHGAVGDGWSRRPTGRERMKSLGVQRLLAAVPVYGLFGLRPCSVRRVAPRASYYFVALVCGPSHAHERAGPDQGSDCVSNSSLPRLHGLCAPLDSYLVCCCCCCFRRGDHLKSDCYVAWEVAVARMMGRRDWHWRSRTMEHLGLDGTGQRSNWRNCLLESAAQPGRQCPLGSERGVRR